MKIAKQDIPAQIDVPGAVARQQTDFGDATGYGKISGEYFTLAAGTDFAPLLHGLEGDLCHSPHLGLPARRNGYSYLQRRVGREGEIGRSLFLAIRPYGEGRRGY